MISINKLAIADTFGRAANTYYKYADLQRRSAQDLLKLLKERKFTTVLDAGCGPGYDSYFWSETGSSVTALDLSPLMLAQAQAKKAASTYLIADIEDLPLADEQFDLVWSHLAVQWCTSLKHALNEFYRVTRPGGKIAFTTMLANSLHELSQAWLAVDSKSHVNQLLSREEVETAHKSWHIRCYVQSYTLYFNNALNAMRSLKGIGATHLHNGRSSKLLTRHKLQQLEEAWPQHDGYYPLTYQLFHGVIERD